MDDLERVMMLVKGLPEKWRKRATEELQSLVLRYEENEFMSREEREQLLQLRRAEHERRMEAFRDRLKRGWK